MSTKVRLYYNDGGGASYWGGKAGAVVREVYTYYKQRSATCPTMPEGLNRWQAFQWILENIFPKYARNSPVRYAVIREPRHNPAKHSKYISLVAPAGARKRVVDRPHRGAPTEEIFAPWNPHNLSPGQIRYAQQHLHHGRFTFAGTDGRAWTFRGDGGNVFTVEREA